MLGATRRTDPAQSPTILPGEAHQWTRQGAGRRGKRVHEAARRQKKDTGQLKRVAVVKGRWRRMGK